MPSASFSYGSTNQRVAHGPVNTGMSTFEAELRMAVDSLIFVIGRTLYGRILPSYIAGPLRVFLVQNFIHGRLCGEVLFAAVVLIRQIRHIFLRERRNITKDSNLILITAYTTAARLMGDHKQAETMFDLGLRLRRYTTKSEVEELEKIMISAFMQSNRTLGQNSA